MKNRLTGLIRAGTVALVAGSFCLAGSAFAQMEKTGDAEAPASIATTAKNSLTGKEKAFIVKATKHGMFVVAMGRVAEEHAQSDHVKAFGKRMVANHSKANNELKAIAEKEGVTVPSEMPEVKWTSDKAYMDTMVKDHEKDLAAFKEEAKVVSDPALKKWTEKTTKMIAAHLKLAQETQSKLQ